jgi:hypothetical protein
MNWTIVTAVVAVYGALLSTWNALSKQMETRRRVTVKYSYGYETYAQGARSILHNHHGAQ